MLAQAAVYNSADHDLRLKQTVIRSCTDTHSPKKSSCSANMIRPKSTVDLIQSAHESSMPKVQLSGRVPCHSMPQPWGNHVVTLSEGFLDTRPWYSPSDTAPTLDAQLLESDLHLSAETSALDAAYTTSIHLASQLVRYRCQYHHRNTSGCHCFDYRAHSTQQRASPFPPDLWRWSSLR